MTVCACVRVCARARARRLQKVAAKIARSPLERHLVRRVGTRSSGFEGKKLFSLSPRPTTERKGFSSLVAFLERRRRQEARLEPRSPAIWRARDGSTATCRLSINISLITIEIPESLTPLSDTIRYPPVNNLYTLYYYTDRK